MAYVKLKTAINKIKDNSNLYMTVKDDNEHLYSIKNGIVYRKVIKNDIVTKFKNMGSIEQFIEQNTLGDKWQVLSK